MFLVAFVQRLLLSKKSAAKTLILAAGHQSMDIYCILLAKYVAAYISQHIFITESANHSHQATLHTNKAE